MTVDDIVSNNDAEALSGIKHKKINKESVRHTLVTLKYSLYLITHPLDAFWDLTREKKGSLAAANIIIILTLLTYIWRIYFTSFIFMSVYWNRINLVRLSLSILIPILVGCLANWSLTTLFDGKGTMRDIYMAVGYSLTPYVLIQIPMIFLSNVLTMEEAAFYAFFYYFSMAWCALLLMCAVIMIHDFSIAKGVLAMIATVAGMLVIIFLFMIFFSLVSDAVAYFISIYKEITYRFY